MSTAIILFAHGSRIESANDAVRKVAAELARAGGFPVVEASFLELGKPDLASAVAAVTATGARSVTVIPYFLTLGTHLERDLPRLIEGIALANPGLDIRVTPPLDGHPALVQVLLDRARY
ncbi:MAG: CbiX/SirB N-terminal domain-containing protein [Bryobacteraceae bacterium]|jgi:sirohydrochlorin ferrochelatase